MRILKRVVTSGSLYCWADGLLRLTSFLQVNGLITRVRFFFFTVPFINAQMAK